MHTKNMVMDRERITLTFELMAIFLSFQMTFSLVIAAVVWAILESTLGLEPSPLPPPKLPMNKQQSRPAKASVLTQSEPADKDFGFTLQKPPPQLPFRLPPPGT